MSLAGRMFRAALKEVAREDDPETAAIELCALGLGPLAQDAKIRVLQTIWQRLVSPGQLSKQIDNILTVHGKTPS